MAIDAKKMLTELQQKARGSRGRVSLYLDKELVKRFRKLCLEKKVSPPQAFETLMKEFINAVEDKGNSKR